MSDVSPVRSVVIPLARVGVVAALIAVAGAAMPGCIVVKSERVIVSDLAVPNARLDQITLHSTTESEVRALLGQPASRESLGDNRQLWTYRGSSSTRGTVVVIEDGEEIRTTNSARGRVQIELTDGVVTAVRRE